MNCLWQYRGSLSNKKDSKISGDGRTYDNKFYTFKEANYKTIWEGLELLVKHLDAKSMTKNVSVSSEEEEEVALPAPDERKESSPGKRDCTML